MSYPQSLFACGIDPLMRVCGSVCVPMYVHFFLLLTDLFQCDVYHGTSSIISLRGSEGGPLALICCVIGHWI